jgi:pimeloyl-ACP methyl ester carboxylesterase
MLVLGHSTGGAIALQLALREPQAVLGLVLVDTGAHMRGHGDVDAILDRIRSNWGEELRAAVLDRSFQAPFRPEVRAAYLRWAEALSQQAVYDVLASQRDLDLTGDLAGIVQPVIVVHGRHDRARSPQQGRQLAQSLPDAEFRLADAGPHPGLRGPRCRGRRRARRAPAGHGRHRQRPHLQGLMFRGLRRVIAGLAAFRASRTPDISSFILPPEAVPAH